MLNIMRADLYRILRGKALYITGAIFLIMIVLLSMGYAGTVGVNVEVNTEASNPAEALATAAKLTGSEAPFFLMGTSDNVVYFMLAIIFCIAGSDFSAGCIKNVLSQGVSKTKLYLSKMFLAFIFTAIAFLLYVFLPMLINTIQNGFGSPGEDYLQNLLAAVGLQMFLMLAVTAVGIFLVFATQKTGAIIGGYIAFCMAPMLLIMLLSLINSWFEKLAQYELTSNIRLLANISMLSSTDITRIVLLGITYLAVSIAAGLSLFRKSEIR